MKNRLFSVLLSLFSVQVYANREINSVGNNALSLWETPVLANAKIASAGELFKASYSVLEDNGKDYSAQHEQELNQGTDNSARNSCNSDVMRRVSEYTYTSRHQPYAGLIFTASAFYLCPEREIKSQCHSGQYPCRGKCISLWQACEEDSSASAFNATRIFQCAKDDQRPQCCKPINNCDY